MASDGDVRILTKREEKIALLTTMVAVGGTFALGAVLFAQQEKNNLNAVACGRQFPRVAQEKNIPPDATLTFASKKCKAAWKNANGVKGAYSWDPVKNVVAFPASAVKTPAPAQ